MLTIASPTRVAVVGSPYFPKLALVSDFVATLPGGCVVVTGSVRGVDRAAGQAARSRGLDVVVHISQWRIQGLAGSTTTRNPAVVDDCEALQAFWDGHSSETRATIELARSKGRRMDVVVLTSFHHGLEGRRR